MFIKFGKEEYLLEMQSGKLYMQNLQSFIDLEKTSGVLGVGDKYDGLLPFTNVQATLIDPKTNALMIQMQCPVVEFNFGYTKCPIFCMFLFDYRNYVKHEQTNNKLTIYYEFTKKNKECINKDFGSHALAVTNHQEFFRRINLVFQKNGYAVKCARVNYYDEHINSKEHMYDVFSDNSRVAFWKREAFKHQQEFRYMITNIDINKPIIIDIGNIADITHLLPVEKLLDTHAKITHDIEEEYA